MDSSLRSSDRAMVKIANHTPASILRNVYNENNDQRSPSRIASSSGVSRHRVGTSPVRVKRSTNDSVPTAVVTPSPPLCLSTKTASNTPLRASAKTSGDLGHQRYISFNGIQLRFSPAPECANPLLGTPFGSSSSLSRRSRSSIGSTGLGLLARKLEYQELEAKTFQQHQERGQRGSWLGDHLDTEYQVPSNSILTLHSLLDDRLNSDSSPRDDSQERRMKELESRLQDIEMRLLNSNAANKREAMSDSISKSEVQKPIPEVNRTPQDTRFSPSLFNSHSTPMTNDYGVVSVAVPPMMGLDGGIFRVQPTPKSEIKVQREIERLEKKLKHQEEVAEALRTQHYKQIEQLTRQLASNDDITQTLRSRIRELELENELWQNRFRLYNDVDVAKILRDNERLRSRQRKRSSRDENDESGELQKKEAIEEENEKLRTRFNELENKYRSTKEKYKEGIKAYRTRHRQDHIEMESLKVSLELQNAELSELRKRLDRASSVEEPVAQSASSDNATNSEYISYNLEKCQGIVDCLTNICAHIKRNEPLDPADVLDYSPTSITDSKSRDQSTAGKSIECTLESLSTKMTTLHSMVVDLYGDDLANAVSCNIQ